jgi:hypothetical protein
MPLEETVISRYVDKDFGVLELIETRTMAVVDGGPGRPLVFRQWIGKPADFDIIISNPEDPPIVTDDIRAAFRSVLSNVGDFKRRIARNELENAMNWRAAAELDFPLDESRFAGLLKIVGFTVGPSRLTVWLQEPRGIFGGHSIEVRIEKGEIIEVCLAG